MFPKEHSLRFAQLGGMRGDPFGMKVLRPAGPAEAVRLYSQNPEALPLAGGTDLMVAWNSGRLNSRTMLDLSRLKEWRGIEATQDGVRIGPLATHCEIESHPAILKRLPLLAEACSSVGAVQIRHRGTIGGNIANASPAGDSFPALAVYEAFVHTVSQEGRRSLPILELFAGVKKTALKPGELIERIDVRFPAEPPDRQVLRKVGSRQAQTLSKTVGAGLLWLGRGGVVLELRFAFGSVAPTVKRLKAVEAAVNGRKLTAELIERACALLAEDISPIDDIRSTRQYRMVVSRNILRAFLAGA
ncbi:MAG: xanthine dehydrogenase family protein subunit M [Elusimicrobia bacterium]|nr:xanthine dehydrogenase family protein subunit M [Elusimicrobiota bacterium]